MAETDSDNLPKDASLYAVAKELGRDECIELAQEVLDVLALQQEYFKTRDKGTLARSKHAEAELRRHCQQITGVLIR